MASSEFAPEQLSLSLNVQVLLRLPLSSHTQMDQLRAAMAARKAEVARAVSSSNNPSATLTSASADASASAKPQKPSYVRRADLEAARLKRLREEEEAERAAKVRERKRKR